MLKKTPPKKLFWVTLLACFLLSGIKISVSANPGNSDIIINEFVASNGSGLTDEDGDHSDWLEIYNRSNQTVNLAGWALTNDPNQPGKWLFPDMNLGSQEYLVIFASGKNRQAIQPGTALHTNFKLSKEGSFLGLYNILETRFMDQLSPQFPRQFKDMAYGRQGPELAFGFLSRPTPGSANEPAQFWGEAVAPVEFSAQRGYYSAPFQVTLTTATPGATIYYTTNGRQPTAETGTPYTEPVSINATTTLQAVALKAESLPAAVTTQTYIFLDDVLAQPATPAGFPPSWDTRLADTQGQMSVSPIAVDYAMDPQVVNNQSQNNTLIESLSTIPALSLVMDLSSLTDLHTPADDTVERPVSIELITPGGNTPGIQVNAGIRPYGAATTPKQSFRLLFKGEYGPTKLEYPVFANSPVSSFDSLLLLAGEGDNFAGPNNAAATYTRNAWLRESQREMSTLGAHNQFVHLYINGLYWGLYNLAERPDATFMASYLGDEKENWFVANQTGPVGNSDTPGRVDDLFALIDLAGRVGGSQDLLSQTYAEIAASIDRQQFSDYLILHWYAGLESWDEANGFIGIHRQDIEGRGGQYIVGDTTQIFTGNGPNLALGPADTLTQTLFDTLLENPDFQMMLADRLYLHLFNDGTLTDANAIARWQTLEQAIDPAIVAESARWGDARQQTTVSREDWREASNRVLNQLEGNAARLISMAREAGYYPRFDPPQFSLNGGLVEAGAAVEISLPAPCKDCTIYYTTDGSDPRLPVTGDPFPTAKKYSNTPVTLTSSTQLKARLFDPSANGAGQRWSALHQATFNVVKQDNKLRMTELMYNPTGGDDYEFIELKNVGSSPVALANLAIDDGIRFTFPASTPPLAPNQFVILASNPVFFAERYPNVTVIGAYEGHLSNKGERVVLLSPSGETLLEFAYNDEYGWPLSPDGRGDSLTLVDESGDPNNPKSWRASSTLYGSPGADD